MNKKWYWVIFVLNALVYVVFKGSETELESLDKTMIVCSCALVSSLWFMTIWLMESRDEKSNKI